MGSKEYTIELPPDDCDWDFDLGIWFETEWGHKDILVKRVKNGKYAFNHTDVHVGDALLCINGTRVSELSFDTTMQQIKDQLAIIQNKFSGGKGSKPYPNLAGSMGNQNSLAQANKLVLTFRTLEERKRLVQWKAKYEKRKKKSLVENRTPQPRDGSS